MSKLLLHACCGVCALEPVRLLKEESRDFSVAYINSNIHPQDEYEMRLDALKDYVCEPNELDLFVGKYDTDEWNERVAIHGQNKRERCRACYRLRFEELAQTAAEKGYDSISTTLTISPYQYKDIIFEELDRAAKPYNLQVEKVDYSEHYWDAQNISRQNGMYRQKYCGCSISIAEAEQTRKEIKERRKREKAEKRAAREREEARIREAKRNGTYHR